MQAARLRASAPPYHTASVLHLAQEGGYFAQAGLEVELHPTANAMEAIPLLAGGKLDVSLSRASPSLINAFLHGARLRIVAGREITSPTCGDFGTLYGSRQAFPQGFHDVRALKGKRVALQVWSDLTGFFLDVLLESGGLSREDIVVVGVRHQEAVPLLLDGRIDAMISNDFDKFPAAARARLVRGPAFSRLHPDFQFSHIIFGRRLLQMDVAVGAAFLAAYLRAGADFVKGKTPMFLEKYALRNNWDPWRVRGDCRNTFTVDGTINLESLQFEADWAARRGYIKQRVRAADLIDRRFLAEAAGGGA